MASGSDFPARGRVLEVRDDARLVVFQPDMSSYEWHLLVKGGKYEGPVNAPVRALLRCQARKVWTVPSGGSFVTPITGQPRTIQGRVKHVDERTLVLHAGTSIIVDLPADDSAIDLTHGPVARAAMVNVVAMPGATLELLAEPATVP